MIEMKFAKEIIEEIKKDKEEVLRKNNIVSGEEFEKWLRKDIKFDRKEIKNEMYH